MGAIVWLVRLEGRVNEAHRLCAELKSELKPLRELEISVGQIKTEITNMSKDMERLADSVEWLRSPASYDVRGVTPPKG